MTQEEKVKAYDEALEKARIFKEHLIEISQKGFADEMGYIFPELKEPENERIRKQILNYFIVQNTNEPKPIFDKWIAWLKKKGDVNETINRVEFAQSVLRGAAINLITWIDYKMEGNMCLSNMECKDIENALVRGDWDKIYDYMKKKLEKQCEQKWSEEDEKKRKCLIKGLEDRMGFGWASDPFSREEYINWLKSLKERWRINYDTRRN